MVTRQTCDTRANDAILLSSAASGAHCSPRLHPMICAKHNCIAITEDHGWPLCLRCFREAIAHAEDQQLEARIRSLRAYSVSDLMQRLRWNSGATNGPSETRNA